ncbi:hypothetical protein ScPMuIL_010287 [Solemya velum]
MTASIPVPDNDSRDDCRLWIGNLDPRVTEFVLLKILQKQGNLKKFDFLYHKSGMDQGKPRGFCFATYNDKKEAERAMKRLNSQLVLSKPLAVRWAHAEKDTEDKSQSVSGAIHPCSTMTQGSQSQIQAIEAKLRSMEENSDNFTLSFNPAAPPGTNKLYSVRNTTVNRQTKPYRRPRKR